MASRRWRWNGTAWVSIYDEAAVAPVAAGNPTGTLIMWAGAKTAAVIPTGYLECNGAAVSRTTYAALFAVIGTTYGTGDGSTTFNLPTGTSAVPFGIVSTANTRAVTVSSGIQSANHAHSLTALTLGNTSVTHTHNISSLTLGNASVGHTHNVTSLSLNNNSANHSHSMSNLAAGNATKNTGSQSTNHTHNLVSGGTGNQSADHNHALNASALNNQSADHNHALTSGTVGNQSADHTHATTAVAITFLIKT